jgi:dUTP pyrophosphatase
MSYTLELLPSSPEIAEFYKSRQNFSTDAGIDLYCPNDLEITMGQTSLLDLQVKCRMLDPNGNPVSYYVYPRSSISQTPLSLANSVGIIDRDYRGNIKAAFRHNVDLSFLAVGATFENLPKYTVKKGTRLVQITSPTLDPLQLKIVDCLDDTARGTGGFGSTGL